jgi:pSer/pThr/pTyr-binding forkhead associated (FHA) protein
MGGSPPLKVVVDKGPSAGEEVVLGADTLRIGRDVNADLRLQDDAFVSSDHAEITCGAIGPVIRNLSPHGTLVNGKPVIEVQLVPGDRISVGQSHLLSVRTSRTAKVSSVGAKVPQPPPIVGAGAVVPRPVRAPLVVPRWLVVYLALMAFALAFFSVIKSQRVSPMGIAAIVTQEAHYADTRKLPEVASARVIQLLVAADVQERRGNTRGAYEAYRELMAVRRPSEPQSPAFVYAASRVAAIGAK